MHLKFGRKTASFLALILIFAGFFLIYFWPEDEKYTSMSIERVKISPEGEWVEINGEVGNITKKTAGETLSVCTQLGNCISVYYKGESGLYYLRGLPIRARGEIGAVGPNKFLNGHDFEIVR